MRAWIEINYFLHLHNIDFVALFMRAWIEIVFATGSDLCMFVALFMRAWIEINQILKNIGYATGRPLHEGVD